MLAESVSAYVLVLFFMGALLYGCLVLADLATAADLFSFLASPTRALVDGSRMGVRPSSAI